VIIIDVLSFLVRDAHACHHTNDLSPPQLLHANLQVTHVHHGGSQLLQQKFPPSTFSTAEPDTCLYASSRGNSVVSGWRNDHEVGVDYMTLDRGPAASLMIGTSGVG
jgi:hypothetical protein